MTAKQFGAMSFHNGAYYIPQQPERPNGPQVGDTTVVERWNGKAWEEWLLVWDGERYVRQPEQLSVRKQAYDA